MDRLWWLWQQRDVEKRLMQYSGQHMRNSTGPARLSDNLLFLNLGDDMVVSKVMNTQDEILCYQYY